MRINSINTNFLANNKNNLSFQRVIPLNFKPTPKAAPIKGVDPAFMEISDILNSNEPFVYSKKESKKIREFFRQRLDDYNGKNGIMITRAGNKTYLISGKDTKEIQKARKEAGKDIEKARKHTKDPKQIDRAILEARARVDNKILAKSENGCSGKPYTLITFDRKDLSNLRFDSILYYHYYNSEQTEKFTHEPSGQTLTSSHTMIYDKSELKI